MSESRPKRRTQAERKADTVRDLIRAAIRIFARKGYSRATSQEIAEEAGYTAGLVNHRFGSKAGLLKALIGYVSEVFVNERLGDAVRLESADESLRNYVDIYLGEVGRNDGGLRALYVVMGEAIGGNEEILPEIVEFDEQVRERIAVIVRRGVASGEFRQDVDPVAASVMITGMVRGVAIQLMLNPAAFDMTRLIPMVQDAIVRGITD